MGSIAMEGLARRWIGKIRSTTESLSLPLSAGGLIDEVRNRNLTYLSSRKLTKLATLALANERRGLPGIVIEAGCALGGSAILLTATKSIDRPLRIYDVFGMIPPPSDHDGPDVHARYEKIRSGGSKGIGDDTYYGYRDNLLDVVLGNFTAMGYPVDEYNVQAIKGLLQDTLIVDEPVALAHIDVDWYEPVRVCLERIEPMLSGGGSLVLDDYFDWSGCKKATDEYFATRADLFTFDSSAGSLVITKR
jgi:O-methyltransferase